MKQQHSGVLIAREGGVIVLAEAIPVSADFMAGLDRTLAALGLPSATTGAESEIGTSDRRTMDT